MTDWTPYSLQRPPMKALCVFFEEYSRKRWVGYDHDFSVWGNRVSIWWILTGIELMRRESERERVRAHAVTKALSLYAPQHGPISLFGLESDASRAQPFGIVRRPQD